MNAAQHPRMMLTALPTDLLVPAAQDFLYTWACILQEARQHTIQAQNRQRQYADEHRQQVSYSPGDLVLLSTRHLCLFRAYPSSVIAGLVHFQFYAYGSLWPMSYNCLLTGACTLFFMYPSSSFIEGTPPARPPPILVHDVPEYEVEALLQHRYVCNHLQILVLWKGYPLEEATWEPMAHLVKSPDLLQDYFRRHGLQA